MNSSYCKDCGAIRVDDQLGLESTPERYIERLVGIFREVRRVLKDDGTIWIVIGDSYWGGKGKSGYELPDEAEERRAKGETFQTGHNIPGYMDMRPTDGKHPIIKPKDLIGIPWMLAFALRADGWYLRSDTIWNKPNPMPESVKDRPTKSHEYVFLLSKSKKYFYDQNAIKEVASGYDGRKDDKFKGGLKNYDGVMPNGKPQTFAQRGHKRWEYKNLQEDGQQPNSMHLKRLVGEEYLSPVRNKRDVWTVVLKPFKGKHFAVFPPDLIEPCILASTSEKGECRNCGKAWVRVTEHTNAVLELSETAKQKRAMGLLTQTGGKQVSPATSVTTGWRPQCDCDFSTVPQIVLDPFGGAGTTALVALKHGRDAILCELNPNYIELTKKRLNEVQPKLNGL